MIGKITKGKSFAKAVSYVLEKEEAELIFTNMAGENSRHFYQQLRATQRLNRRVISPVAHISISFPPGERPDEERSQEITERYMEEMGFDKNLYLVASHKDKGHFHLHIIASRIKITGECVPDWQDRPRSQKILRKLEQHYGLTPVKCSWEVEHSAPSTGQKRRCLKEKSRYERGETGKLPEPTVLEKIQTIVDATVADSELTMSEFLNQLSRRGIEVKVRVTRSGVIQGLSYGMEGVSFQAGKLGKKDRPYTLKGLQKRGLKFDLQQDVKELAARATSNSQEDTRQPSEVEVLILQQPKNFQLAEVNSTLAESPVSNLKLDTDNLLGSCPSDIDSIQRQRAEKILPAVWRTFERAVEQNQQNVVKSRNGVRVSGINYEIVCEKKKSETIFSLHAKDGRDNLINSCDGELISAQKLTEKDVQSWAEIAEQMDKLDLKRQRQKAKQLDLEV